jgi:hypothetical protein
VSGVSAVLQLQELEQRPYVVSLLSWVPHRLPTVDDVSISAASAAALEEAGFYEVGNDSLRRAFGDPDVAGDISEPNVRIVRDAQQHLRVVRDERPTAACRVVVA